MILKVRMPPRFFKAFPNHMLKISMNLSLIKDDMRKLDRLAQTKIQLMTQIIGFLLLMLGVITFIFSLFRQGIISKPPKETLTTHAFLGFSFSPPTHYPWTALIPAGLGVCLIILGGLARNQKPRKVAMHLVMLVAGLGFLMCISRIIIVLCKHTMNFMPVLSQSITAILCAILLFLGIRSFRLARLHSKIATKQ